MNTTASPSLLTVGTLRFARNSGALVDTLFAPGGTASGIYRKRKHNILFMRPNGEPFACLIANPGQSQFFVSAFKLEDGRTRYSYGLTDADASALGVSRLSYSQQADEAARIWDLFHHS